MLTVYAYVTHLGEDYATIKLVAQIIDTKNPENSRPSMELEAPKAVGEWLAGLGAIKAEE